MKVAFILLALGNFALAAPRISQISPSSGIIDGEPVAWDIDQDGDLDLAYLYSVRTSGQIPGIPIGQFGSRPQVSTWLKNLGDRKFSAPRSLGHTFDSSRRKSLDTSLVTPQNSDETFVLSTVRITANDHTELYFKTVTSPSWQLLGNYDPGTSLSFLKSPDANSPVLFICFAGQSDVLTMWSLNNVGGLVKAGEIPLPMMVGAGSGIPRNIQAADLDLDGDSDLILELEGDTYFYERVDSGKYLLNSTKLEIEEALIGDLNLDGLPDLIDGERLNGIAINLGSLQFNFLDQIGPNFRPSASFLGKHENEPVLFAFNYQSNGTRIFTYKLDESLNFANVSDDTNLISNSDRPHVADFDGAGNSEVTFISRSNPFRSFIGTRGGEIPNRVVIPSSTVRPNFDQVVISGDEFKSLSDFSRAACEAPVMCDQPAMGDFNNDGATDLVVGPDAEGNAWIMLNDGHGGFTESRVLTELVPPGINRETFHLQDFVPVDLNEDGFLDLSFSLIEPETLAIPSQTSAACAVALGDGTGSFEQVTFPPGSFETVTIGFCGITEFTDWDGDGDQDAILQGAWRENVDGVLREGAYPLVRNAPTTDALGNPVIVSAQHVSDVDGDGFPDLFLPALTSTPADIPNPPIVGGPLFFYDYTAGVAFNSGNGDLAETSDRPARLLVHDAFGNPVVLPFLALDLDLDGRRELLTADPSTDVLGNPVFLRLNRWTLDAENPRDLSLARSISIPAFSIPFSDELVDFNGDGELEYAAEDQFITPTLRGPLLSPKYLFKGDHLGQTFPALNAIAVADFDNDGDLDSLYAEGFSGLHLVRNTLVDEDSPITAALVAEGLTPSKATPQVDADGDGRSNALEFLQGTDPLLPDSAPEDFLKISVSKDGRNILFSQPTNSADFALYFDLQSSDDLVTWTRVESDEKNTVLIEGNFEKVSMEIPRSDRKKYYRISATHDPRR